MQLEDLLLNPLRLFYFIGTFYRSPYENIRTWDLGEPTLGGTTLCVAIHFIIGVTGVVLGRENVLLIFILLIPAIYLISSLAFTLVVFLVFKVLSCSYNFRQSWMLNQYIYILIIPLTVISKFKFLGIGATLVPIFGFIFLLILFIKSRG